MKLREIFISCVLFALCSCTRITTMADFVRTIDRHNGETINNVWYMGTKGEFDFFRHNTALSSCTYKIHAGLANASDRFPLTSDPKKWLLIKGNGRIMLNRIRTTQCTITNVTIIINGNERQEGESQR